MNFYPEGVNDSLCREFESISEIKAAIKSREIFEGTVILCDSHHNLFVDLGCTKGIIPRGEGAIGIIEGTVRDIALISKVNRRVCFRIMGFHRNENGELIPLLSRRNVQLECIRNYIDTLSAGDIISARVTRLERFGAFIDIGAGINSLIPIDMLSVSRIMHPAERLYEGQLIRTVLRKREEHKLTFSLKELLGTWEENAGRYSAGETVTGVVRSVENYGIFVELAPNLAGLAEPCSGIEAGQKVSVFIKSIIPERMKIKLVIVEAFSEHAAPAPLIYFAKGSHIDEWNYSPQNANKYIFTKF